MAPRQSTVSGTGSRPSTSARASSVRASSVAGTARPVSRQQGTVPVSTNTVVAETHKRKERDFDESVSSTIDPKGTNIQVVVRCRGRSAREIKENSQVVVAATGGLRGKEVTVSNGLVVPHSNKTYTFDRVFGPEADQAIVYDDVVAPILDEMLLGYNCTIFAYGQTGTGKTYTMSGDMNDNYGTFANEAGIIPRTLYRLFHLLDADGLEYSVKISFIELYNEELKDLLAVEDEKKVKIYEDTKKNVVVQGMEESLVSSAEEGVKKLQEGSYKRQVAATKCNDLSSRSHTVFSITVHIKEKTDGEDVLRIGKLNLVDLAGSENIGRSGAENKRAREAGMINQSLLTLGRVINALVERSQHIPYRESKLTRLLQDSLGGRTKTCIIANVSPAKMNLEETLSTLEYANKAKSIHNKPQVNQTMTKKTLLRDFCVEIEKLKADLRATRQKQGVYMTQESYQEITDESESRRAQVEENERKIEAMEIQLKSCREQFEQNLKLLLDTKKDLEKTTRHLQETSSTLAATKSSLSETQEGLSNEIIVRKAHEATEAELDTVATKLKKTVVQTVDDIKRLHAKVGRKAQTEDFNRELMENTSNELLLQMDKMGQHLQMSMGTQTKILETVSAKFLNLITAQKSVGSEHIQSVESTGELLKAEQAHTLKSFETVQSRLWANLDGIAGVRDELRSRMSQDLYGLNATAEKLTLEIAEQLKSFQDEIHNSYSHLGHDIKLFFDATTKHLVSQQSQMDIFCEQYEAKHRENCDARFNDHEKFTNDIAALQVQAKAEKSSLLQQVTKLVESTFTVHEDRLVGAITTYSDVVNGSISREKTFGSETRDVVKDWALKESAFAKILSQTKEEVKGKVVSAAQVTYYRNST